jgi:glycosyltransferase involved in cell wall biosynthesis
MRRVLFVSYGCYLDSSNGASIASRAMMEALGRHGFVVEALSGPGYEHGGEVDPADRLAGLGICLEASDGGTWIVDACGLRADVPPHDRLTAGGVRLTLARRTGAGEAEPEDAGYEEFLRLYDATLRRFRPEVLVNYGSSALSQEIRSRARRRGAAVVFALHNCNYHDRGPFADADAVIVPSRFAAEHYRNTLGLECTVLPNLVDLGRVLVSDRRPRFLSFVNPSYEKGVYAFARIADEMGRRRPDIPLLVVESRGNEQTLADCGLDLRLHGTVHLMGHTSDPRHFWSVTRLCLMPSLAAETQGLAAVEAMANGIPVIASDRGALPETLGEAGITLPLPERLTPATRFLPTAEEVAPWLEAITHPWDDEPTYRERSRRARLEAGRWDPEILEPQYVRFLGDLRPGTMDPATTRPGNAAAGG